LIESVKHIKDGTREGGSARRCDKLSSILWLDIDICGESLEKQQGVQLAYCELEGFINWFARIRIHLGRPEAAGKRRTVLHTQVAVRIF
jgi:hypothetical protein